MSFLNGQYMLIVLFRLVKWKVDHTWIKWQPDRQKQLQKELLDEPHYPLFSHLTGPYISVLKSSCALSWSTSCAAITVFVNYWGYAGTGSALYNTKAINMWVERGHITMNIWFWTGARQRENYGHLDTELPKVCCWQEVRSKSSLKHKKA